MVQAFYKYNINIIRLIKFSFHRFFLATFHDDKSGNSLSIKIKLNLRDLRSLEGQWLSVGLEQTENMITCIVVKNLH